MYHEKYTVWIVFLKYGCMFKLDCVSCHITLTYTLNFFFFFFFCKTGNIIRRIFWDGYPVSTWGKFDIYYVVLRLILQVLLCLSQFSPKLNFDIVAFGRLLGLN
jgi:hypothetical protein